MLTACQKPFPTITISGNGKSVLVDAARYQFAGGPLHTPIQDVGQAPDLHVRAGSELLVDVPRSVADNVWVVSAYTLDSVNKAHPLAGAGTANAVRGRHTTHLSTTPAGVGDYYLQVAEISTGDVGGWVVHVITTA